MLLFFCKTQDIYIFVHNLFCGNPTYFLSFRCLQDPFREGWDTQGEVGMGCGSCEPPELPDEVLTQSQDGTGEAPCVSEG